MMPQEAGILVLLTPYIFGVLGVALALALVRLVIGPSLPDRVVALDMVAMITIAFIAVHILVKDEPAFLNAAAVLALAVFLGTLAYARYLEKRGRNG